MTLHLIFFLLIISTLVIHHIHSKTRVPTMYPLTPCQPLRITHYDTNYFGSSCQMGWKLPTRPWFRYVAAPNWPLRSTARPCGVCYEVVGPMGATRVMVVSGCPDCDQDHVHFDLSDESFPVLVDQARGIGRAMVTYREISCDSEGPVKLRWKYDTNQWSFYVVVFNHAVGVETLEMRRNGQSSWENLTRETWNEFRSPGGGPYVLPFDFRVTSFYGDSIDLEITRLVPNAIDAFPRQFVLPRNTSAPFENTCCAPQDIHSEIYVNDALQGCWEDWSGFAETMDDPTNPHSGTVCISGALIRWQEFGYGCNAEARVDQWEYLQFWARTNLATTYDDLDIRISSGKYRRLHVAQVPGLTNVWQEFNVPIAAEVPFFSFSKISWKNEGRDDVTLYLDDIRLTPNPNAPNLTHCAPGVLGGVPLYRPDWRDWFPAVTVVGTVGTIAFAGSVALVLVFGLCCTGVSVVGGASGGAAALSAKAGSKKKKRKKSGRK